MEEVASGIYLLTGFPRYAINAYLVEDVLVDAATRWRKRKLLRQLKDRTIRMAVLTHCHPDHQGCAHAVCSLLKIPLACHEEDLPAMEGKAEMVPLNWLVRLGHWMWAGPTHPVSKPLTEGEEIAGFKIIHTPGHTPGHILLFRESDRVAIAGDLLANINLLTGKAGLREPPPFLSADRMENRRSLRKLVDLRPSLVCFGHGPPLEKTELLEVLADRWNV